MTNREGLRQRDRSKRRPACHPEERAFLIDERFDGPPLAHHYFELFPGCAGFGSREGHQTKAVISHCGQLGSVVLDVAVPGDGNPLGARHHGDPVEVPGVRGGDGAERAPALVEGTAWVAGIGDVGAQSRQQLA